MKYGRQTTMVVTPAGVVEQSEEQFVNWNTIRKLIRNTETVQVKTAEEVMAQFLKLLDLHNSGEARDIGIYCKVSPGNDFIMVEKTWVVTDLREQDLP